MDMEMLGLLAVMAVSVTILIVVFIRGRRKGEITKERYAEGLGINAAKEAWKMGVTSRIFFLIGVLILFGIIYWLDPWTG